MQTRAEAADFLNHESRELRLVSKLTTQPQHLIVELQLIIFFLATLLQPSNERPSPRAHIRSPHGSLAAWQPASRSGGKYEEGNQGWNSSRVALRSRASTYTPGLATSTMTLSAEPRNTPRWDWPTALVAGVERVEVIFSFLREHTTFHDYRHADQ
jgi:hypothetical protein